MRNVTRAVVGSVVVAAAMFTGYETGSAPAQVGGCYVLDAGTPDAPSPVLVSDTTDDGLCHTEETEPAVADVSQGRLVWDGDQIYADVEDAPALFADELLAAGFYGDPNDGRERLYAPLVLDVEKAPQWVVDALTQAGYHSATEGAPLLYAPDERWS